MSNCLLCDQVLARPSRFIPILLFQKPVQGICDSCKDSFERIADKHCPTCYKHLVEGTCLDCLFWQEKGEEVSHESLFIYNDAMADYFSRFKFQGDYLLRKVFADELRQALTQKKNYKIVPIPLSEDRYRLRGFNQVTALLDAAGLPYQNILGKTETEKQSEKTRAERIASQQAFFVKEGMSVPENIILMDDIYTTGATMLHAKRLLMKMGAKKITTFSLSR